MENFLFAGACESLALFAGFLLAQNIYRHRFTHIERENDKYIECLQEQIVEFKKNALNQKLHSQALTEKILKAARLRKITGNRIPAQLKKKPSTAKLTPPPTPQLR